MFEQSLVESTAMLRTRSRKPVYSAIAIQAAIAAALLSIPILHPEVLPLRAPQMTLTAPPLPHPEPPPPQRVRVENTAASSGPTTPILNTATSHLRSMFQQLTTTPVDAEALLPSVNMSGNVGAGPTGWTSAPTGATVSVRAATPAHQDLLSISTGVMAGRLIVPITPVYPNIARMTHTEGIVVIEAVISTSGRIESAHAVSGPAVLQAAALDAVRNARYHPYLLNGAPTEVQTTITVNFRMGS